MALTAREAASRLAARRQTPTSRSAPSYEDDHREIIGAGAARLDAEAAFDQPTGSQLPRA